MLIDIQIDRRLKPTIEWNADRKHWGFELGVSRYDNNWFFSLGLVTVNLDTDPICEDCEGGTCDV